MMEETSGRPFFKNLPVFFRLMYERTRQISMLILSVKGDILDCNSAFIANFNYNRDDLLGKNFSMLFIEEDRKKKLPELELSKVLEKGQSTDNNFQVLKNGNKIWVQGESVLIDQGDTKCIVKLILDIHEQKKLEEFLIEANNQVSTTDAALQRKRQAFEMLAREKKKQAEFYEAMLSYTADFVYAFDLEGKFSFVNSSLLKMWGLELKDVLGKTLHELGHPQDITDKLQQQVDKVIKTRRPVKGENFFIINSEKRFYEYIFSPIFDGDVIRGIASITRDMTDRHKLESELKHKNETLDKINRDMDNFTYTASHDLKAPIGHIEGLLAVLEKDISKDDFSRSKEIMARVNQSLHKFKVVLEELADTSKMRQKVQDEINFEEIIEETKLILQDLIDEYQPVITTDLAVSSIHFSRKNLRSIFQNLISNGIKYSAPDRRPEISICTKKSNGMILIQVKDNGLGIKEEEKSRAFKMYERLHHHVEGTGVGLGLVARIVDNAGGKIRIESEVGRGTALNIYLPASTF